MLKTLIRLTMTLILAAGLTPAAADLLEEVRSSKTLRVGLSTFVPWAMRNRQGELVGFEVDVARRLAEDNEWTLELVPTAWDGIIPSLVAGKFDVIIGGLTITPERARMVAFSDPYAHSGIQVVSLKDHADRFPDAGTFNKPDVALAVRRGATTARAARKHFPRAKLRQFDDDSQAYQELLNGRVDGVVGTSPLPAFMVAEHPDRLMIPFKELLDEGNEAMAVRKGETAMIAHLNTWISQRETDGWLAERHAFWFENISWKKEVPEQ
jgi:polar amino acid transport system substrate-binding protein